MADFDSLLSVIMSVWMGYYQSTCEMLAQLYTDQNIKGDGIFNLWEFKDMASKCTNLLLHLEFGGCAEFENITAR